MYLQITATNTKTFFPVLLKVAMTGIMRGIKQKN